MKRTATRLLSIFLSVLMAVTAFSALTAVIAAAEDPVCLQFRSLDQCQGVGKDGAFSTVAAESANYLEGTGAVKWTVGDSSKTDLHWFIYAPDTTTGMDISNTSYILFDIYISDINQWNVSAATDSRITLSDVKDTWNSNAGETNSANTVAMLKGLKTGWNHVKIAYTPTATTKVINLRMFTTGITVQSGFYTIVDDFCFANQTYVDSQAYTDKIAAKNVIGSINTIGTLTADSGPALASIRTAYKALTVTQKALVTNYTALSAAERNLYTQFPSAGYAMMQDGDSAPTNWSSGTGGFLASDLKVDNDTYLQGQGSIFYSAPASGGTFIDGTTHYYMMWFIDAPVVDLTKYPVFEIGYYHNNKISGSNSIQINLCDTVNSSSSDGINVACNMTDQAGGWWRKTYDTSVKADVTGKVHRDNINRLRVTYLGNNTAYCQSNWNFDGMFVCTQVFWDARTAEETRVQNLITALPTPTAENWTSISSQIYAVRDLIKADKAAYPNFYLNNQATYNSILTAYNNLDVVSNTISLIDAIGAVTAARVAKITTARTAYDALTAEQQAQVTNYSTLTAAEEASAPISMQFRSFDNGQGATGDGSIKTVTNETQNYLEGTGAAKWTAETGGTQLFWYFYAPNTDTGMDISKATSIAFDIYISDVAKWSVADTGDFRIALSDKFNDWNTNAGEVSADATKAMMKGLKTGWNHVVLPITLGTNPSKLINFRMYTTDSTTQAGFYTIIDDVCFVNSFYPISQEYADKIAAKDVSAKINAIGTVTADSGDAINNACVAYNNLTDAQKALVVNKDVLSEAAKVYFALVPGYNFIKDGDSITGWQESISGYTLSLDTTNQKQGSSCVAVNTSGTVNKNDIFAMICYLDFDAVNINNYPIFELYYNHIADMTDGNGLQINFCTKSVSGDDGKNAMIGVDNQAAGWIRQDINTADISDTQNGNTKNDQINRLRISWLNYHDYFQCDWRFDGLMVCTQNFINARTVEESLVKDLVSAIPMPTVENYESIKTQINTVKDLLTADKAAYPNFMLANQADFDSILAAYNEFDVVSKTISLIDAIGTVTSESGPAIAAARGAYDALDTQALKDQVTNYTTLTDAEKAFADLNTVADVISKIDAIGSPVTLESETTINTARSAYDALGTQDLKDHVTNYTTLTDAEKTLTDLKAVADVISKIDAIGSPVTLESKTLIDEARTAYDALGTQGLKDLVTNYNTLTTDEKTYADLIAGVFCVQFRSFDDGQGATGDGMIKTVTNEKQNFVEGTGAAKWTANAGTQLFWYFYAPDTNTGLDISKASSIAFDIYISDATKWSVADTGDFRIALSDKYNDWNTNAGEVNADATKAMLKSLQTGWNHVVLPITLGADPSKLINFRIYTTDSTTQAGFYTIIDDVCFASQAYIDSQTYKDKIAAKNVSAKINAIGTVTAESGPAITDARNAYNALTDAQKPLVATYATLTAAEVANVISKINAIGTVTTDSGNAINNACIAYNNLSNEQKALVVNKDVLSEAAKAYFALVKGYTMLADCDSLTGWGAGVNGYSLSLDIANVKQGASSIFAKAPATLTPLAGIFNMMWYIDFNAVSINQYPIFEFYYNHSVTMTEKNGIQINLCDSTTNGGDGKNYSFGINNQAAGWYRYSFDSTGVGDVTGKLNNEHINRIRLSWLGEDGYYPCDWNFDGLMVCTQAFINARTVEESYVKDLVSAIPTPTADNWASLSSQINTVKDLLAADKAAYPNFMIANQADFNSILTAYNEFDPVSKTISLIDAIGTVTTESGPAIAAARSAYDALSTDQRTLVTNYSTLIAAEEKYKDLTTPFSIQFRSLDECQGINGDGMLKTIAGETQNYVEGTGAVRWTANEGKQLFWYFYAPNTDTGLDISKASYITFDIYISDATKWAVADNGDFRIALSDVKNEWNTNAGEVSSNATKAMMKGLQTGWNHVVLPITPGTDPSKLINFRMYTTDSTTQAGFYTIIDDICFINAPYRTSQAYTDKIAAKDVSAKINAIGTVTKDSGTLIADARSAYNALTSNDVKALVATYNTLTAAETEYADIIAVNNVISKIDAIGTVTKDSGTLIADARSAYDALASQALKDDVTNYETLTTAEKIYDVIIKIEAIGTVTKDSGTLISTASNAFNGLTDTQKGLVTNSAILTAAIAKFADIQAAEAVIIKINAIGTVTRNSGTLIATARTAYDALTTQAQKDLVSNYATLTTAEGRYAEILGYGDVNGDGKITAADALLALQKSVSKIELTESQTKNADVDGNSKITANDALLILQFSVEKISSFPIEKED